MFPRLMGVVLVCAACSGVAAKPDFEVKDPDGGWARGSLLVDGKTFEAAHCGTGEMWGFRGVIFEAKTGGQQVWVAWQLGDQARVTIQDSGTSYTVMKGCGKIRVDGVPQPNGPDRQQGHFEVDCKDGARSVKAKVTFNGCV
jgi:hypothetical protein